MLNSGQPTALLDISLKSEQRRSEALKPLLGDLELICSSATNADFNLVNDRKLIQLPF